MFSQKEAKTMARLLRNALGNRNVQLSHSDCLEIVAKQFGLADWNTLAAKIHREEQGAAQSRRPTHVQPFLPAEASINERGDASAPSSKRTEEPPEKHELVSPTHTAAPWSTCSFCGKSQPEVRIVMGGCGGWEGFRARRNPESGERSNVFICHECADLSGRIVASARAPGKDADALADSRVP